MFFCLCEKDSGLSDEKTGKQTRNKRKGKLIIYLIKKLKGF